MAEVGTRSSMTSNHGRGRRARAPPPHARTYVPHTQTSQYVAFSLLTSLLLLYIVIPSYVTISLTPFYTTHAPCPPQQQLPSGNNKTIHNQGVGERSEPHSLTPLTSSLLVIIIKESYCTQLHVSGRLNLINSEYTVKTGVYIYTQTGVQRTL